MGFYFKVAPGVKIRATRRGLRASVGPRAARIHVGAGGTGISTGAGPVSLYHSVGGGRGRRQGTGSSRTSIAAYERQLRQAQKMQQAQELRTAFDHILNIHREDFPSAVAPVAPTPQLVDEATIRRRHEQEALNGLNVFQRSARTVARQQATEAASQEILEETARRHQEQQQVQRQLDEQWHSLLANDPDVVFATLTEAFEDNDAPAVVAGVEGGEVSVIVMAPDDDIIPERMPRVTDAGNLSLAKLPKSQRNSFYVLLICGHILVAVREVLAVAPGIKSVRVVVVRRSPPNAYGVQKIECLMATVFTREAIQGIQWQSADAATIVQDASDDLHIRQGTSNELKPLDLSSEPALAALLGAVDLDELGDLTRDDGPTTATGDHVEAATTRTSELIATGNQLSSSKVPPPWQPKPGWGTVRDFTVVVNDHGGTDVAFNFIPDDGSEPIPVALQDFAAAELDEYARGIMTNRDKLDLMVSANQIARAEQGIFRNINELDRAQRALMYAERNDIVEKCGWTWTSDYKLERAAPGLTKPSSARRSTTPVPWRPRPGWGTIRDYQAIANDRGGTDLVCKFIPDDGGESVPLVFRDVNMPELGEYARGIMLRGDHLTVKVPATSMLDVEHMFEYINRMELTERALMYAQDPDLYEGFGWTWTPDYKLVRAAPGLL